MVNIILTLRHDVGMCRAIRHFLFFLTQLAERSEPTELDLLDQLVFFSRFYVNSWVAIPLLFDY